MSLPIQVALTVGPLAIYFYVVGVWQSGGHPRVIGGRLDFAILAFGVSGLLTVGPVGQVLIGLVFGMPGPIAWVLWLVFLGLWTAVFSGSAARRLVVYNLEPARTLDAVRAVVGSLPDAEFAEGLAGFEDKVGRRSLSVEGIRRFRVATVDARGRDAEALIRSIRPLLRARLGGVEAGPTRVTWGLFALSWLTMLAPLTIFLATEPKARAAVRAIWRTIGRG